MQIQNSQQRAKTPKGADNKPRLTMNQTSKEADDGPKSKKGRQRIRADKEPNFKRGRQWAEVSYGQNIKGLTWAKNKKKISPLG
jgi:hypothetical protein